MTKTAKAKANEQTVVIGDPAKGQGRLKSIGGSTSDEWNRVLANATIQTTWFSSDGNAAKDQTCDAVIAGLIGIGPKDEIEGMLAAQLMACHQASMECFRRAMIPEQTFDGRRENLTQANKASRTYAVLLDALNKHRGKGQQKVTVEHVHVHSGGQAIVGNVTRGAGHQHQSRINLMSRSPYQFQTAPRCHARSKRTLEPCRNPAVSGKRVCRNHGAFAGAPLGNTNALKHGQYTAEAIARRRHFRDLMRQVDALLGEIAG